jgi:uncharacterized membrane protein (UPF0127 family)
MSYLPFSGKVFFENVTMDLKVATDPVAVQVGMMGATSMDYALAFKTIPGPQGFWMKNCVIPLDMIFCTVKDTYALQEGSTRSTFGLRQETVPYAVINKIHRRCPPCYSEEDNCPLYRGYADFVIEVPGGFCRKYSIEEGQKVFFKML